MTIYDFKQYTAQTFSHPLAGVIGAFFMSIFTFMYGDSQLAIAGMTIYMFLIVTDWISGYRASKLDGSYSSEYGIQGAYRTVYLLLIPALAHLVDEIMNTPNIVFGFILIAFGQHIWNSMTANVYRAGWGKWVPISVLERVSEEIKHKEARARERKIKKEKDVE